MKVAVSITGDSLEANVDPRFGRAQRFLIYDLDSDSFSLLDNEESMEQMQGAGIQTADKIAKSGAEAVITGHCGPKAFQVLQTAGIRVLSGIDLSVKDAVQKLKANELQEISGPDRPGHRR